jgi:hypothetical protein
MSTNIEIYSLYHVITQGTSPEHSKNIIEGTSDNDVSLCTLRRDFMDSKFTSSLIWQWEQVLNPCGELKQVSFITFLHKSV